MTELRYAELLQSCNSFNRRICAERRHRMPFLDAQTGVAQSASNLWRKSRDRQRVSPDGCVALSDVDGFVYRYPSKRWRSKPGSSVNLLTLDARRKLSQDAAMQREIFSLGIPSQHGGDPAGDNCACGSGAPNVQHDHSSSSVLESSQTGADHSKQQATTEPKMDQAMGELSGRLATHFESQASLASYQWYDDVNGVGILDDAYLDERLSDGEDYEEKTRRKRSKKSRTRRPKDPDGDKPHRCAACGARYKTKPGLQYHTSHQHADGADPPPNPAGGVVVETTADVANAQSPGGAPLLAAVDESPTSFKSPGATLGAEGSGGGVVCDFCLGDAQRNNKTLQAEPLVACKDCGRAGHPTCLQFTPNMIVSTSRHGWQCIDCKSCAMCGTSENDDQLLFCDDCDRGFHMYCLKPALLCAPEGNWSCHLCILEFGSSASNPAPP